MAPQLDMDVAEDGLPDMITDAGMCPPASSTSLLEIGEEFLLERPARNLHASLSKDDDVYSLRLLWQDDRGLPQTATVPVLNENGPKFGIPSPVTGLSTLFADGEYYEVELARAATSQNQRGILLVTGNTCGLEADPSHRLWIGATSSTFDSRFLTTCRDAVFIEGLGVAGGYNAYDNSSLPVRIHVYSGASQAGMILFFEVGDPTVRRGISDWTTWPETPRVYSTAGRHVVFNDTRGGLFAWDIQQNKDTEPSNLGGPIQFRTEAPDEFDVVHIRERDYLLAHRAEGATDVSLERIRVQNVFAEDPVIVGRIDSLPETPELTMTTTHRGLAVATRFSNGFHLYYSELPTPTSTIDDWQGFESTGTPLSSLAIDTFRDECNTYVTVATVKGPDANILDVEIFVVE